MRRVSPGEGVNRRSFAKQLRLRRASRLELSCAAQSVPDQQDTFNTKDPLSNIVPRRVGELLEMNLVDQGSVLHYHEAKGEEGWGNKCLQKAILCTMPWHLAMEASSFFAVACANDAPTGGLSDYRSKVNLLAVQACLEKLNAFIWVVSADSRGALGAARVEGR